MSSKPEVKKKVFLKLAKLKNDKVEENSWIKRLGSNLEVFYLLFFFI